jgi:hypothetical protein
MRDSNGAMGRMEKLVGYGRMWSDLVGRKVRFEALFGVSGRGQGKCQEVLESDIRILDSGCWIRNTERSTLTAVKSRIKSGWGP